MFRKGKSHALIFLLGKKSHTNVREATLILYFTDAHKIEINPHKTRSQMF